MLGALLAVLLAGCSPEEPPPRPGPQPVKVVRVGAAAEITARVVGVVRAHERTTLAFQVAGRIASVEAEIGDRVERGRVVAKLDRAPFELRLAQARAEVARATAILTEARARVLRQERLLSGGWVAPAAVESVRAEAGAAGGTLDAAQAAEAIAQRDLTQTALTAPFAGLVARRLVEPFTEVAVGAPVFELDSAAVLELVAPVPAALADAFQPGAKAIVFVRGAQTVGRIERVSPRSGEAGTSDAIVRLADTAMARAGDTAELVVKRSEPAAGFDLPLTALLLSTTPGQGTVLVVETGHARRRAVTFDLAPGETVRVLSGITADDVVVAAGARFLKDGEAVAPQEARVN